MALGDMDMGEVMRRLAERRIEQAMAEGKFDNLPGAGKPLKLEPAPADEAARALWWALRIMKQNDVLPPEIERRRAIAALRDQVELSSGDRRRELVERHNALVRQHNHAAVTKLPTLTELDG